MEDFLSTLGSADYAAEVGLAGAAASSVVATLDSGADVHVLSYDAAITLFHDIKASRLKVVGVSGVGTAADIRGHLIVTVESPVTLPI